MCNRPKWKYFFSNVGISQMCSFFFFLGIFYYQQLQSHELYISNKTSTCILSPIGWVDDVILLVWPPLITDSVYVSCFLVFHAYFALIMSSFTQSWLAVHLWERHPFRDHVSTCVIAKPKIEVVCPCPRMRETKNVSAWCGFEPSTLSMTKKI